MSERLKALREINNNPHFREEYTLHQWKNAYGFPNCRIEEFSISWGDKRCEVRENTIVCYHTVNRFNHNYAPEYFDRREVPLLNAPREKLK